MLQQRVVVGHHSQSNLTVKYDNKKARQVAGFLLIQSLSFSSSLPQRFSELSQLKLLSKAS